MRIKKERLVEVLLSKPDVGIWDLKDGSKPLYAISVKVHSKLFRTAWLTTNQIKYWWSGLPDVALVFGSPSDEPSKPLTGPAYDTFIKQLLLTHAII